MEGKSKKESRHYTLDEDDILARRGEEEAGEDNRAVAELEEPEFGVANGECLLRRNHKPR